jgi:cysteine-rich repeat protein
MKSRFIWAVPFCGFIVACSGAEDAAGEPPSDVSDVYSVTLGVTSWSELPKCNATRSGTVAAVISPPSLWSCQGSRWVQLPCTELLAGAVAYAHQSNELWTCASGKWTPVALPTGAAGPQGPIGPQGATGAPGPAGDQGEAGPKGNASLIRTSGEPPGANCPAGGQRIDVGVDIDGDGELADGEIQQSAYLCHAVAKAAVCGDSVWDAGEECDTGGQSVGCEANCTIARCGDGILNPRAHEECDSGSNTDTSGCLGDCRTSVCGDGRVNRADEQCDDGNSKSGDGCSYICMLEP